MDRKEALSELISKNFRDKIKLSLAEKVRKMKLKQVELSFTSPWLKETVLDTVGFSPVASVSSK